MPREPLASKMPASVMAPRESTMVARLSDKKTMTVSMATFASSVMTVGTANMPLSWDKAPEVK